MLALLDVLKNAILHVVQLVNIVVTLIVFTHVQKSVEVAQIFATLV